MAKVLIPLAKGFEEIEAVAIIDVLRRASIEVITGSVDSDNLTVTGANQINIKADILLESIIDVHLFDMIILPGGFGGTNILSTDNHVQKLIQEFYYKEKFVGAICAAPFALYKAGILNGDFTCYPSVEEKINNFAYRSDSQVVINGKIVTSRGPGTAICFALDIVSILVGQDTKDALKNGLLADYCK